MGSPIYSYQQAASTTSKLEQIVMFYDGAIKFLLLTADNINRKDMVAKAEHIDRALAILDYLRNILDMKQGGQVAKNLDGLYNILISKIVLANATLDNSLIESSISSLREMRSAWQQIAAMPDAALSGIAHQNNPGASQPQWQSIQMIG